MRKVLVTAAGERAGWIRKSVLARSDISLTVLPDVRTSLQYLCRNPPDLYVACDDSGEGLDGFWRELRARYPQASFPALVLARSPASDALPSPVKVSLPLDPPVDSFNEAVMNLLSLPSRQNARFPIRMGLGLGKGGDSFNQLASTVNISVTGLLVESLRPLTIGSTCTVRFIGTKKLASIQFSARVLRQEEAKHPGSRLGYYALEWQGISANAVESFLGLLLKEDARTGPRAPGGGTRGPTTPS